MKIIAGPRGSGKTTRAIEVAEENDAHLVVSTERVRRQLEFDNPDFSNKILSHHQVIRGSHMGMKPEKLVIDEVDAFIGRVTNYHPVAGTVTPNGIENLEETND